MWSSASPSQLKTFRDCKKKWHYNKILELDIPSTGATDLGDTVHKYIEDYLAGKLPVEGLADEIVAPSIPFLDEVRGKNPIVEISFINEKMVVPYKGRIDLFWIEGRKGYVVDHKTSGNFKYIPDPIDLIDDPQAIGYSAYVFDTYDIDEVEFSLHFLSSKKPYRAKFVTVHYTRESIIEHLKSINNDLLSMVETSKMQNSKVDKNENACFKFGPCPFRARCLSSGTDLIGGIMASIDLGFLKPKESVKEVRPTIYIGCRPDKAFVMLEEFATKEIKDFCEKEKLPHYLVDPYNKGPRVVAANVWYDVKNGNKSLPEHLVVDPISPLGSVFISLIHEVKLEANLVMSGIR